MRPYSDIVFTISFQFDPYRSTAFLSIPFFATARTIYSIQKEQIPFGKLLIEGLKYWYSSSTPYSLATGTTTFASAVPYKTQDTSEHKKKKTE